MSQRPSRTWNNDHKALLSEMYDSYSYALIAIELNERFGTSFTRSAVSGKVRLLGLSKRPNGRTQKQTLKSPIKHTFIAPIQPIDDSSIPLEQRKSIFELTDNACRFPVGDPGTPEFFFCGAPSIDGSPYCAGHHLRCYAVAA